MNEKQKEVLKTVVNTLKKNNISFQVSGGLAAIAYGAKRPLYDIDIIVSKEDIPKLKEFFKEYITEDFQKYEDEHMEVWGMTLEIDGVEVDITQAQEAYFKDREGNRTKFSDDLSRAKLMEVEGIEIPVEYKEDLIAYKKAMARDVDLEDLKQIS